RRRALILSTARCLIRPGRPALHGWHRSASPLRPGCTIPAHRAGRPRPSLSADHDRPQPRRRATRHWTLRAQEGRDFAQWNAGILEVASSPNAVAKLAGLGMPIGMFDFYTRPKPPSSEELATAYKPYIETCIAAFGVNRAMFERIFPPDGASSSYQILWNALK